MSLHAKIEELVDVAEHPAKLFHKYLGEGKTVVGVLPIYCPEELIHAGGMIPFGMWGGQVQAVRSKEHLPVYDCSIMHSILELAINGAYDGMACAMVPIICDTFRGVCQAWPFCTKTVPLIPFTPAQNRSFPPSVDYMEGEYRYILKRLENHTGKKITMSALADSIEIYNEHNAAIREFCKTANDHLDVITPYIRHCILKSAFFMEKSRHTAAVVDLTKELKARSVHKWQGKKVIITGISAEPKELLDLFEENGFAVVGDDIAQESRQYCVDIPQGYDQMNRLIQKWYGIKGDPCVHDDKFLKSDILLDLARTNGADGIVVCMMKFCDPDQYQYAAYLPDLKAAGIPVTMIEIDQGTSLIEQNRTRLQTFAEILS